MSSGPDFCFFGKIQLESFQKTHFWPGAPQGRLTKKMGPDNWDPKMDPTQRHLFSVHLALAWKKVHRPPSMEATKLAQSARSALDLSKEAKIRVRGGGGGAVR